MSEISTVTLNNGVPIPQFGFGVFQIEPERTADAVKAAFDAGYRHIDTAQMHRNEEGVGRAIADSGIPRDEIFVTTKLDNARHGHDEALGAIDESLDRLGLDHVDLFLIHWPRPKEDRYVQTWKAFEQILRDGRSRAIGVSNFQIGHLERLAAETGTVPAVNQIELHPHFPQAELRAHHRANAIGTEAWSPLAQGGALLTDERLVALAEKYGRTPAQIILRWHIELGNIVFPKSVTPARIRENIDVFDFELAADDLTTIGELETGARIGPNPDDFG
ncbi:aldo/keto reductase [Pseudonocardia bannensis]|uniref:Aldo/keto reductase n=1 Tax=Pseudonocardia bannensis TaxID=630973 RepID=A0A848DTA2_9PSEU|nr:aldo/keto reductase [Pseudonocardia bannensis]NMH95601.1 aldo/keto reductase [Pseudonocardia bannensis]